MTVVATASTATEMSIPCQAKGRNRRGRLVPQKPPTGKAAAGKVSIGLSVKCPQCSSLNTRELTRFGSTSCKALYVCQDCREPFDYFKVH